MDSFLLVINPKYDDGTEYLSYYSSLILKEARSKNINAKDFEGKNANRDSVVKFLKKQLINE